MSVLSFLFLQHTPVQTIGDVAQLLQVSILSVWMLAAHHRDSLFRTIPTRLTPFLVIFFIATDLITGVVPATPVLAGALFGGCALLFTLLTRAQYLGTGDAHVLFITAYMLGPHTTLLCLLLAGWLTIIRFVVQREHMLPFGADLAFATIAALLLQDLIEPWLIFVR